MVNQSVQDHHLTKDDAFKVFTSIMYASHMCAGSADVFQSAIDHLLQKNNLPSFSVDFLHIHQQVSQQFFSNPDPDSSIPPFPSINMTPASAMSETPADVVSFVASETSEVPAGVVSFAVSSLLTHVRNSENSTIKSQISQSNHSSNTELDRSIEVTKQETPASSRHLDNQKFSNSFIYLVRKSVASGVSFRHCSPPSPPTVGALPSGQKKLTIFWRGIPYNLVNDTFHSVVEEPFPHRQQLVPVIPHDTTEMETSNTEASSSIMLEDSAAS